MTLTLKQACRLRDKTQIEMAKFLNICVSTYMKFQNILKSDTTKFFLEINPTLNRFKLLKKPSIKTLKQRNNH